ncbi:hypothetical protein [Alteraurantiacibacter palmitatis]|uniref:Uncharacterized protein n=1 Tax=Alteraurantiacibacter palmitatis TaxID=2054628 RepID=A0ABV7E5C2_9SPHN
MLMRALDTLHVSAVGPDIILAGQTFEIADNDGEILRQRGLAEPVEKQPDAPKPARTRTK